MKDVLDSIDQIADNTQLQIEIMWIPGHADVEAKKAATDITLIT